MSEFSSRGYCADNGVNNGEEISIGFRFFVLGDNSAEIIEEARDFDFGGSSKLRFDGRFR